MTICLKPTTNGLRCINFGQWRSLEDFTTMDPNRAFSPIFGEMLDTNDQHLMTKAAEGI